LNSVDLARFSRVTRKLHIFSLTVSTGWEVSELQQHSNQSTFGKITFRKSRQNGSVYFGPGRLSFELEVPQVAFLGQSMENIATRMTSPSASSSHRLTHFQTSRASSNTKYQPQVYFWMAYDDANLCIKFVVRETYVRARYTKPQDPVYTDSCVEFFVSHSLEEDVYYNFEFNCIGCCLAAKGKKNGSIDLRTPLSADVMKQIRVFPSLGFAPFEQKEMKDPWELTILLPVTCFGVNSLADQQLEVKCNLYKCGDELEVPHWISYFPIQTDRPNFHRPDAFQELCFTRKCD